jgi:hypothetical protein
MAKQTQTSSTATLAQFLADEEVPLDIRRLVKSRLDPDPPWKPGPDEKARDAQAAKEE